MNYAAAKIDTAKSEIAEAEQRILRQRRRVEKMLVERHPADEAQAQLLIMEQSLISMTRFLMTLERDLDARPGHAAKRIKAAKPKDDAAANQAVDRAQ